MKRKVYTYIQMIHGCPDTDFFSKKERRIQQKLVGIGSDEWNQFYNNADSIYKYIWTRA